MQREVTLIFGQTGSGKTTHAIRFLKGKARALVVEADFNEFPALRFSELDSLVDHLEKAGAFSNFDQEPVRLSHAPFRVSYSPRTSEHELVFALASELGNCTLLIDEADRFDDPRELPEYDEVITRGRHYGVGVIACGLHFFKLPKELRRQATRIIAGRQVDPGDLEALSEIVGPLALKLGPDERGIFKLGRFDYLEWTAESGARLFYAQGTPVAVRPEENKNPIDEKKPKSGDDVLTNV